MRASTDQREFELQIFDGKEYRVTAAGLRRDLEPAFESLRPAIRRLVLPEKAWPAKPKYTKPRGMMGYGRSRQDMMGAYMAWAEKSGLKQVHVYAYDWRAPREAAKLGIEVIPVTVADFMGPAPDPETEE